MDNEFKNKNENENENGEDTMDLTLTLGSPYPSQNIRQHATNPGQMVNNGGGSSSSINYVKMEGESKNENGNENEENTVDLTFTLGSPYSSQNVRPVRQQSTSPGQMMNGGGASSSINNGSIDANMNPVSYTNYMNQYHPLYNALNNNIDRPFVIELPLMTSIPHANFTFGNEGIGGSRRRGTNVDPNRRCSNASCNTNDTPMWRKGPLGPKTLCNACGIKYRKEEQSKADRESGTPSTADS